MKKYLQPTDRYLAIVWLDQYGVPTGISASYFADIPGDRLDVQKLFQPLQNFRLLGDFMVRDHADAVVRAELKLMTERIPEEARAQWPSPEDYADCAECPVCGFMYHSDLLDEVKQHNYFHTEHLARYEAQELLTPYEPAQRRTT